MNLEEAIKTAIDYEIKVTTAYEQAHEKATDPVGKRIFAVLAKEEQGHVDYLKACLEQWQKTGKVTPQELDTAIPKKESIAESLGSMQKELASDDKKRKPSQLELELLNQALAAEEETSGFYRRMVDELDKEGRDLFRRFLEIEEGHVTIVRAEIDSVNGLGYWMDMAEFQLEAG